MKMEVRITSSETIKPYSKDVHVLKPFKLSFLDQLMPPYYVPIIFFYTQRSHSHSDCAQISAQLKQSLSKTLNIFYPISGRPIDNFCIDYYGEGVPFIEARVNGCLSDDYLQTMELEKLNQLLPPCEPFCYISDPSLQPLVAVQLNIFDCGGMALGMCSSHKLIDATTTSAFLKSWAAFSQGSNGEIPHPHLLGASSQLFRPVDWNNRMPPNYLSTIQSLWFKAGRYKTRTFVFDADAVATLIFKAKSRRLKSPSRAQALTAFIWKHAMLASRSASGLIKPSVLAQAVNLRQKLNPKLPYYSIGNLIWFSTSTYTSAEKGIELHELAYLANEAVESFNTDYLEIMQGDEGINVLIEQQKQLAEFTSIGNAEVYGFSSLLNINHEFDFGWGKPIWFGMPGVVTSSHNNFTFLNEIDGQDKAVEAWITLDEKCMAMLEQDPEFLAFASPNPHYDKIKI